MAVTELHLISPADPAPVQLAVIKVGLNTTDDKKIVKKKIWNKNDCWPSKTRSKHIIGSKDGLFIRTKQTVCKLWG